MAFPCIHKGPFLLKSPFKSTYCKCFCTCLSQLMCINTCESMAWMSVYFNLLVLTLQERKVGFSRVLKKVRCAVLLTSHIGSPVLKILTRIFEGGKECPQLQAWKQFLVKGERTEGTIKRTMTNSCDCKMEQTSVNSITVHAKYSNVEHLFLYPCGEGCV